MFPGRYFGVRFFTPHYFPKVGGAPPPFMGAWVNSSDAYLGPLGRTVIS
jgi:hypothetical protein